MRIAVCDDEKESRELLGSKAGKMYPDAEILLYGSGDELLAANAPDVDILFLDIQMTGQDGMETARELRRSDRDVILIFVTALEEYVFQAFDVGAFHYLVKPIGDEKFEEVLRKAVMQLADGLKKDTKQEKYLMINSHGVHTNVQIDSIVYAEVFNR